jgi:hypothetical protein
MEVAFLGSRRAGPFNIREFPWDRSNLKGIPT